MSYSSSTTTGISLFQIRYLFKKKTKYCQVILYFKNKKIVVTEKKILKKYFLRR